MSAEAVDDDGMPEVMWGTAREFGLAGEVVLEMRHDGDPKSKARARVTRRGRSYTPKETIQAEHAFAAAARSHLPVGWRVDSRHHWGILAVFFQANAQRRDIDNMLKLVSDALTGVIWKDDSQVSEVSARLLRRQPDPRTHVRVYKTSLMTPAERPCERCGTRFPIHPGTVKRFCGRECANASRRKFEPRACEHCGQTFQPSTDTHRACSRECRQALRTTLVTCPQCGVEFRRPTSLVRPRSCCSPECLKAYRPGKPRSNRDLQTTQTALELTEGTTP